MAKESSIEFDAGIKTGNLEKDLEKIEESISDTASEAENQAEETFNIMLTQAKKLAAEYEKSGMKSSEALRKAWNDMKGTAASGANSVKQTASRAFDDIADSAEEALNSSSGTIDDFAGKIKGALATVGTVAGAAEIVKVGTDYDKAMNQVAVSTGVAGKELENLQTIATNVYTNNFGGSMEDAATGAAEVYKQLELTDEKLQTATESAFLLEDTFGYEVTESTKTAKSMISNLGIDAQKAYDLIATGAQKGADSSGELLDTLNEYSADAAEAGLSADQFMNMLINAGDNGVYSIDKVGDAIRELNTRAKDGSDTTAEAFAILGMDAEEMTAKFAAGGQTAQDAFAETITAINYLEDPVARNTAAVGLLGSMYEDVGDGLVTTLASVTDGANIASGALEDMAEVKYNDLESQFESLRRQAETEIIVPLAKEYMPEIKKALGWVSDNLDEIVKYGKPIATALAAAFATTKIVGFGSTAVKTIKTVKAAFTALSTSNPLGWIALGVGAVVGIGTALHNMGEEAEEAYNTMLEEARTMTEAQKEQREALEETAEAWDDLQESSEHAASSADKDYERVKDLEDILSRLVNADGTVKSGTQQKVEEVLTEINDLTGSCYELSGNLITENGEVLDSYEKISQSIDDIIEKNRVMSYLDAYKEQFDTANTTQDARAEDVVNAKYEIEKEQGYREALQREFSESYRLNQSGAESHADWDYWKNRTEMEDLLAASLEREEELEANLLLARTNQAEQSSMIDQYNQLLAMVESGNYEEASAIIEQLNNGFIDSAYAPLEALKTQYEEAKQYYSDLKALQAADATAVTDEMLEEAKTNMERTAAEYELAGGNSAIAFIDALVASGMSEEEAFAELNKYIEEKLNNGESLNKIADELGLDYCAGFEGGIYAGIPGVEEAVKALGAAAEATLRIRLDTHSPSKLSEKIGGWYDEGMIQGVVKGIPDVEAATAQMADAAVSGTLGIMNAQGAGSVSAYSPVYREAYTSPPEYVPAVTGHSESSQSISGAPKISVYIGNEEIRDFIVSAVADENANSGGFSV